MGAWQEMERVQEELLAQNQKLLKERQAQETERKQLAKMLLGMGEKIEHNEYNSS
jgi:hypothetical protein